MSRGINKVILIGTLGKDPELRYAQSGSALASVSVATNEAWKDKNGEKQERTEWHRVKFFGRLAEIAGEYLKKGSQVYIEGSLRTEKYTDKAGVEKYSTDIIANEMQMLGGRPDGSRDSGNAARSESGGGGERSERAPARAPSGGGAYGGGERSARPAPAPMDNDFHDDDIPF